MAFSFLAARARNSVCSGTGIGAAYAGAGEVGDAEEVAGAEGVPRAPGEGAREGDGDVIAVSR